jgi:hypothetical protein
MVEFRTDFRMAGLALIFGWLDWHYLVGSVTDFCMVELVRLGLVLILGWLDWHCMVGFSTDFRMVGLALYGLVWY